MGTVIELDAVISLALEVIAGMWGNGEERRQKLENAGYDYNRVQSCVNDLIGIMEKYK